MFKDFQNLSFCQETSTKFQAIDLRDEADAEESPVKIKRLKSWLIV